MKILLATDGSACSENAVSAISHRTLAPATEIRLITVIPAIEADALAGASLPILDGLIAAQHDEAARKLNVAIAQLKESRPNVIITSTTREGLPEEVILDEARRWHADLIVVGSHGKGAISRWIGSVSESIVQHAPCPVEVIRATSDSITHEPK